MSPNNGYKGDNSMRGTNAFNFSLHIFSRLHNICVTSDKLVFYPSFCNIFFFFENYALFSDKNDNIEYTDCPISTHPAKKITLACYACLCLK